MTYYYYYYYVGWALSLANKDAKAVFETAAAHAPEYCFSNCLEAILTLEVAQKVNPIDSKAPYYLGNLWYDKRQYPEAIALLKLDREEEAQQCFNSLISFG